MKPARAAVDPKEPGPWGSVLRIFTAFQRRLAVLERAHLESKAAKASRRISGTRIDADGRVVIKIEGGGEEIVGTLTGEARS